RRHAGPRPGAAVPDRARHRAAADARAREGSERVALVDAREGVLRPARDAAQLQRRAAGHDPQRAALRRRAADLRRSRARGDGARDRRVESAARRRRRVVAAGHRRAVGRRAAVDGAERRAVTRTYVRVIVLEAVIIALLWTFGRLFV